MAILANSNDFVGAANMSWQQHLKAAVRTPEQLAKYLDLPLEMICPEQASGEFPLFAPLPFLDQIKKGDPKDPLLIQILPAAQESEDPAGFSSDPLNESEFKLSDGLLQKYQSRALLLVNGTCAVHCRYCFRRHFPYSDVAGQSDKWQSAIEQIRNDDSIEEVILSGGDPLTVVDEQIGWLVNLLEEIGHVTRLRVHTRLPIVIPQRITKRLVEILAQTKLSVIFVVHSNHANELSDEVHVATRMLSQASVQVLNQSVLLRGVNDNLRALLELSQRLIEIGVLPYYLHQLDPVSGASHFQVPVERGVELLGQLRATISGYMVPRFVQEIPGELNKTVLA